MERTIKIPVKLIVPILEKTAKGISGMEALIKSVDNNGRASVLPNHKKESVKPELEQKLEWLKKRFRFINDKKALNLDLEKGELILLVRDINAMINDLYNEAHEQKNALEKYVPESKMQIKKLHDELQDFFNEIVKRGKGK